MCQKYSLNLEHCRYIRQRLLDLSSQARKLSGALLRLNVFPEPSVRSKLKEIDNYLSDPEGPFPPVLASIDRLILNKRLLTPQHVTKFYEIERNLERTVLNLSRAYDLACDVAPEIDWVSSRDLRDADDILKGRRE